MFNYDFLSAVTPVDYCCVATKEDAPAWGDYSHLSTRRRATSRNTTAVSQRKRHLDRF